MAFGNPLIADISLPTLRRYDSRPVINRGGKWVTLLR